MWDEREQVNTSFDLVFSLASTALATKEKTGFEYSIYDVFFYLYCQNVPSSTRLATRQFGNYVYESITTDGPHGTVALLNTEKSNTQYPRMKRAAAYILLPH